MSRGVIDREEQLLVTESGQTYANIKKAFGAGYGRWRHFGGNSIYDPTEGGQVG